MWRLPFSVRPMLEAEDGLEAIQRERRAAAVGQGLKALLHWEPRGETRVPAVFDLIGGVAVAEAAAFLFLAIQAKDQARAVNPTVAHLPQSPFRRCFRQGVCNFSEASGVGELHETVVLLFKGKQVSCFGRHVLMTVQNDCRSERRMPAHLAHEEGPYLISDMN